MYQAARTLAAVALIVMVASCGNDGAVGPAKGVAPISQPPPPPPPDVGDIEHFHDCKNVPRRELSPTESCLVDKLRKDCTPAADCVLTCLSSPDGSNVGGGCDHVCFGYEAYHSWKDRPEAMDQCRQLQHGQLFIQADAASRLGLVPVLDLINQDGHSMRKHRYRVTLEHLTDAQGAPSKHEPLQFEVGNHDDIIAIVARLRDRGDFTDENAAAFGVGIKLFSQVMLESRDNPLFSTFRPHFSQFMKELKSGPGKA